MSLLGHKERVFTGLILAAVLLGALIFGGWPLRILMLITTVLALYEFYTMFWPGAQNLALKILGLTLGAGCILLPAVSKISPIHICVLAFIIAGLCFLFRFGGAAPESRMGDVAPLPLGVIYIPLTLQLAFSLSGVEQALVVLAAIGTDTGGYYAGCRFGRHRMWPSVSPKKSWEGAAGGLFLCIILCCILGLLGATKGLAPSWPWFVWAGVGIALNIAAQLGDFFESALKRTLCVKDSGTALPGHGGVLDRVDSLLFVLPVYSFLRTLVA